MECDPFAGHKFDIGDAVSVKCAPPEEVPLGVVLARQLNQNAGGEHKAYLVRMWRGEGPTNHTLEEAELIAYDEKRKLRDAMFKSDMRAAQHHLAGGPDKLTFPTGKDGAD